MADINDVSREIVLSWASRIPWESYIGDGKSREGSSIVVTLDDVRVVKRFAEADQGASMSEALANNEVSAPGASARRGLARRPPHVRRRRRVRARARTAAPPAPPSSPRLLPPTHRSQEARRYPQCLMKILITISDVRIIQYCLTLLEDFVAADPAGRAKYLHKPSLPVRVRAVSCVCAHTRDACAVSGSAGSTSRHPPPRPPRPARVPPQPASSARPYLLPFLQLVGTSGSGARISSLEANPYVLEHAAALAAAVLATDATSDPHATSSLLAWVMTHVRLYGSSVPKQVKLTEVAVGALMTLLRNDTVRSLFVEERGIERLVPLTATRNSQTLYEAVFCLWSLSLTPDNCPALERTGAVTAVARVLRSGMPLKVLRVCAGMLVNVAKHAACSDSVAEMCETHVPQVVADLLAVAAADAAPAAPGAGAGSSSSSSSSSLDPELVRRARSRRAPCGCSVVCAPSRSLAQRVPHPPHSPLPTPPVPAGRRPALAV